MDDPVAIVVLISDVGGVLTRLVRVEEEEGDDCVVAPLIVGEGLIGVRGFGGDLVVAGDEVEE